MGAAILRKYLEIKAHLDVSAYNIKEATDKLETTAADKEIKHQAYILLNEVQDLQEALSKRVEKIFGNFDIHFNDEKIIVDIDTDLL